MSVDLIATLEKQTLGAWRAAIIFRAPDYRAGNDVHYHHSDQISRWTNKRKIKINENELVYINVALGISAIILALLAGPVHFELVKNPNFYKSQTVC
jgi:hypothetical protein